MAEEFQGFKRKHAVELKLDEITTSQRVAVLCNIVSFNKETLEGIISDGTKEAKIFLKDDHFAGLCGEGSTVRVIGKAFSGEKGLEINVEIVQAMSDADIESYKDLVSLEKKN